MWEDKVVSERYRSVALPGGHTPLGIYENNPGSSRDALLVTDKGVIVYAPEGNYTVEFKDIADATWTPESKRQANAVRVTLQSGGIRDIPVHGATPQTADVFEFLRFVMRAAGPASSDV